MFYRKISNNWNFCRKLTKLQFFIEELWITEIFLSQIYDDWNFQLKNFRLLKSLHFRYKHSFRINLELEFFRIKFSTIYFWINNIFVFSRKQENKLKVKYFQILNYNDNLFQYIEWVALNNLLLNIEYHGFYSCIHLRCRLFSYSFFHSLVVNCTSFGHNFIVSFQFNFITSSNNKKIKTKTACLSVE